MKRFRFRALSAARLQIAATAAFLSVAAGPVVAGAAATDAGKLRIICFGAHPDDCEIQAAGAAALDAFLMKLATVSLGWAPWLSQYCARARSNLKLEPFLSGW